MNHMKSQIKSKTNTDSIIALLNTSLATYSIIEFITYSNFRSNFYSNEYRDVTEARIEISGEENLGIEDQENEEVKGKFDFLLNINSNLKYWYTIYHKTYLFNDFIDDKSIMRLESIK